MPEFLMPSLGADMVAGTLVSWLKKPGDRVERGDIIAEVETDKGVIEVEVFTSGIVERLLVPPGTKAPVGTPLAIIRESGATTAEAPGASEPVQVEAADADPKARIRRAIAAAMERSNREIPHFYLSHPIDASRALAFVDAENETHDIEGRLVLAALLIKAVALALREYPELNGRWQEGHAMTLPAIHVGTAISLRGGGVVIPAIHDTDRLPLHDLMRAFRDLVERARGGALRGSELTDGTITITSLGDRGVEEVFGRIYPPQVALVGFGRVTDRPWVADGVVVARRALTATLAADHRVSDGHRAALFLEEIDDLLANPERLR